MFKKFLMAATISLLAQSLSLANNTEEVYLPDLVSPAELSEEFNLPLAETNEADGAFEMMDISDWSSFNGVDILQHFSVVVIVNKGTKGAHAQTARVYFEGKPYATYKISTGREHMEKSPSGKVYRSTTPTGWFRPLVFSPNHYSKTWKAPMPWAIFFNGGIALHATTPSHYAELGRRASGGCVRFMNKDAKTVYNLIKNAGKASVPQFTRSGQILRDDTGEVIFEENYDTLIIVENTSK